MKNIDIIKSFVSGATKGKITRHNTFTGETHTPLFIEGDTIYSYGYHFPLAKRNEDGTFWVNPDKYSVTTSKQQGMVKGAIAMAGKQFV
jgi:hypothetical protein